MSVAQATVGYGALYAEIILKNEIKYVKCEYYNVNTELDTCIPSEEP